MRTHHDVIVVGGGPGGGTAAYELASRGVQVLVLEKESLPRYKPCAGGFPLKAARILDMDLRAAYEMEISKWKCTYKAGSAVSMDLGRVCGWTVMRDKLDYLILERAKNAGARVVDRQAVTEVEILRDRALVRTARREHSAAILVGADGATGIVASSVGLMKQRRFAVAIECEVEVREDARDIEPGCVHFDFNSIPGGYGWVFPKKEQLSVGLGVFQGKARGLKRALLKFLQKLHLPSDPDELVLRGHLVPLGGVHQPLHGQRVVLVGDAASLAEPMTGEGIYYAIKSAKLAAETICHSLNDGSLDLSTYSQQIDAQITSDFKYAHLLARVLYRVPRLCFHLLARSPDARRAITDVVCGTSTFRQLFSLLLKNAYRVTVTAPR